MQTLYISELGSLKWCAFLTISIISSCMALRLMYLSLWGHAEMGEEGNDISPHNMCCRVMAPLYSMLEAPSPAPSDGGAS